MQAYRVEAEIQQNGLLTIRNIPLHAGQSVDVIILVRSTLASGHHYPLRGLPVHYTDPTEPIADHEWDAL